MDSCKDDFHFWDATFWVAMLKFQDVYIYTYIIYIYLDSLYNHKLLYKSFQTKISQSPWPHDPSQCVLTKRFLPQNPPEIPLSAISSASRKLKCIGMLLSLYLNFSKFAQFGGQEMYQKNSRKSGMDVSDFLGLWNASSQPLCSSCRTY